MLKLMCLVCVLMYMCKRICYVDWFYLAPVFQTSMSLSRPRWGERKRKGQVAEGRVGQFDDEPQELTKSLMASHNTHTQHSNTP